jgi:hypothetical protein
MITDAYEALKHPEPEPVEPADERTFGQALGDYEQRTGNSQYLLPIFDEIGTLFLSKVTQKTVDDLAEKLYPNRTPATKNRQVYTPVISILRAAESAGTICYLCLGSLK